MAISVLIDNIIKAIDKKEHVFGLFSDFANSFDTVIHNMLLKSINQKKLLQWIYNYLSNREQLVKLIGTKSTLKI